MKSKIFFLCSIVMSLTSFLTAQEEHTENPHYVWFEEEDVFIQEDGIWADSNKGMIKLNVVDYDSINNRYKVKCQCLQIPDHDPCQALSAPNELNETIFLPTINSNPGL